MGDLKFTMHRSKIWGENAQLDNLVNFFLNHLEEAHLIDIKPLEVKPISINNRADAYGISKSLHRFLIHGDLLQSIQRVRSWVGSNKFLDHFPILLELDLPKQKLGSPFK